jgi:hypothetical protein
MLIVLHGIVDDFCRFLSVFMEFVWHFLWYIAINQWECMDFLSDKTRECLWDMGLSGNIGPTSSFPISIRENDSESLG